MDVVDYIEESLLNLDPIFEKEGLTPIDAYRLKALLENLTKNEVVVTLENLVTDQTALSEIILKIHYVKELLDASSDNLSNDLIQTMNALQHISTNSLKYLTPEDIRFLLTTFPNYRKNTLDDNTSSSPSQSSSHSKLESIKYCKEKLLKKSSQIVERENEVKMRITKLESVATTLKEEILSHIKKSNSISMPITNNSQSSSSSSSSSSQNVFIQKTYFNKAAENRISQLDYDAALSALSVEVNKLEKKLIYHRSEDEEYQVSSRLNDLLMTQIECAEESRAHSEQLQSQLKSLSSKQYNEYRESQLNSAIKRSTHLSESIDRSYQTIQKEFEMKFNEIREKYDEMLEIENNKNISMVRNYSSTLSRNLDLTSKTLSHEYSLRSEMVHHSVDEIVDRLHDQVTNDTKVFAKNFSKVYETATSMLQENREKNDKIFQQKHSELSDNESQSTASVSGCKQSIQTSVYDAFTNIHELQVTSSDPIENFSKVFNQILIEQDTECQEFLKRADETLNKYRKQLLDRTKQIKVEEIK